MENFRNKVAKILRVDREFFRILFAELLGTMFLVALGNGAVAQMVLSGQTKGTFLTVNLAFALAIAFGIYICGGVSGGHINPAVTLCMCFFGRCEWYKLPAYFIGQFVGAFLGSVIVFTTYYNALKDFDAKARKLGGNGIGPDNWVFGSAGIFGTYPEEFLSVFGGFYDQVIGTAILLLVVFAVTDARNMQVPKHLVPLLVGLGVGVIGMAYGYNCGYAINPARDLAPRLFTLIAGWGSTTFSKNNYAFFWAPVVGPFIGAILGGLIYQALVGIHWPTLYQTARTTEEQGQLLKEIGLSSSPKGKVVS